MSKVGHSKKEELKAALEADSMANRTWLNAVTLDDPHLTNVGKVLGKITDRENSMGNALLIKFDEEKKVGYALTTSLNLFPPEELYREDPS